MRPLDEIAGDVEMQWCMHQEEAASKALADEIRAHARKAMSADPGCTCSPSPGFEDDPTMRCPSCLGAYQEKFEAALAASLEAAEAIRDSDTVRTPLWDPAWAEPALTVDQDKVDERYGRIAYEAWCVQGYGNAPWENLFPLARLAWTRAAKAVCVEMAKAIKAVRGGP